ncbi:MAG TPA: molybdenum cofactor guanylyltransferase [Thermoanaerobaculia bacterium]|nr:molybdenum cofactor guanylyltransferase [Thermoanaerobaculia bacterium]
MNAYVLIGGLSRRMGVSKAALFLERIVAAATPVFDDVIAVQRFGGEAAGMRTIFEEEHEGDGAIFGVARALRDATDDAFLIGVDYPLITTAVLRFLRAERGVPEWNGRKQPLCAVWETAALPRIDERIAARRYDLQPLAEQAIIAESVLRARFPGEPLMNVNTPEELEAAERLYG